MDIFVMLILAIAKGFFSSGISHAQCWGPQNKQNTLQLSNKTGKIGLTSFKPVKRLEKCIWEFPKIDPSQALVLFVSQADLQIGKRCYGQIVFPGSQARECSVTRKCRVFAHENSKCSLAYLSSQQFPQCGRIVVHGDNNDKKELRLVVLNLSKENINFMVKYKILDCPNEINEQRELNISSLPKRFHSFLKRGSDDQNSNVTDVSTPPLVAEEINNDATIVMIVIIVLLFAFLVAATVKLILLRNRKEKSPFQNPTVVALAHQEEGTTNESGRNDQIVAETSLDLIPSNTALYAEIGSGAWNANQEIHEYMELPHPTSAETTENRNSRSFPEYLYSKVNMMKKRSASCRDKEEGNKSEANDTTTRPTSGEARDEF